MMLRKAKKPGGGTKQKATPHAQQAPKEQRYNEDPDEDMGMDSRPDPEPEALDASTSLPSDHDTEKGTQILPLPRCMYGDCLSHFLLIIVRTGKTMRSWPCSVIHSICEPFSRGTPTLRLPVHTRYGGILERGSREITMDDFWSLALDKMDAYLCLKPLTVDVTSEGNESSSDDDDGEDDDNDSEEEDDDNDAEEDSRQEHTDPNGNGEEAPDSDVRADHFLPQG